jgi:exosortase/archaeosortase family protein
MLICKPKGVSSLFMQSADAATDAAMDAAMDAGGQASVRGLAQDLSQGVGQALARLLKPAWDRAGVAERVSLRRLNRRDSWLLLCCLQALLGVSVVHYTQDNASVTLLAVIVWWGAALAMEDSLDLLASPFRQSFFMLGALILLFCCWRAYATFHLDIMAYVLFPLQAIGLAFVASPDQKLWKQLRKPIAILSLFGLQVVVQRQMPMAAFTAATAKFVEFFLALFDVNVFARSSTLFHATGSVKVVDGCSGLDLAIQLAATAVIFVLVFPLKKASYRLIALAVAPVIALFVNGVRIAILTYVHSTTWPARKAIFDFLHEQWGGFVFAGIAMTAYGFVYMYLIERQLSSTRE